MGNIGMVIIVAVLLILSIAIYAWSVFFKDIPVDSIGGGLVSDEAIEEARKIIKNKSY